MNDRPPSLARATAILSSDTAAMMADTMGTESSRGHSSSPLRYFTKGVFRLTAAGTQSAGVWPGTSRYSLNVRDGSSK